MHPNDRSVKSGILEYVFEFAPYSVLFKNDCTMYLRDERVGGESS